MTATNLTVHAEKYALPSTIDGICALVREVLKTGPVKRLEMDTDDKFVRVQRWVDGDPLAEDTVTWDGALRNVPEMTEYYSEGATSFQVVVDMMLMAQGTFCTCWVMGTSGAETLRAWLEVDSRNLPSGSITTLCGLPIYYVKSLPDETLILCCSKYPSADASEVTLAIKTSMDFRRSREQTIDKVAGGSRDHTEERSGSAHKLALTTSGLRTIAWAPSGNTGP